MEYCSNCTNELEDGGTPFPFCGHLFCWVCLKFLVDNASTARINCGLEECDGFIEHTEIKWLVSEDAYQGYIARVGEVPDVVESNLSSTSDSTDDEEYFDADDADIERFYQDYAASALREKQQSSAGNDTEDPISVYDSDSEAEAFGYSDSFTANDDTSGWGQLALMMQRLRFQYGLTSEEAQLEMDTKSVFVTNQRITCAICISEVDAGDGVIIKDCLHMFCRECLSRHIELSESVEIPCPHNQDGENCESFLKPREVKQLCTKSGVYRKHYEDLSIKAIENAKDMVHCLTPNCHYFCEASNGVRGFQCPICKEETCLVCKVIHTALTCDLYKNKLKEEEEARKRAIQVAEDEKNRVLQRQNDLLSQQEIQRRIANRQLKPCPRCGIAIEKNAGCDHMTCRKCRHEFYWTTGANWRR